MVYTTQTMIELEQINSLKEYFESAQSVAIVLGPKPTVDQVAVASALYEGCLLLQKEASLYAPHRIRDEFFESLQSLQTELGKQNLVVSFDYDENIVDKVSYHIGEETKKFFLTIKPKKGHKPLALESMNFSYAGSDVDLVFLVGVHDLESLEQLYFGYESLYQSSFVVTLHTFKPEIGNVQLDLSATSSMSEGVIDIIENLGISLNEKMASSLLMGIETATQNLQSLTTTAETFETIARLLRSGARRVKRKEASVVVEQPIALNEDISLPKKPRKKRVKILQPTK